MTCRLQLIRHVAEGVPYGRQRLILRRQPRHSAAPHLPRERGLVYLVVPPHPVQFKQAVRVQPVPVTASADLWSESALMGTDTNIDQDGMDDD